MPRQKFSFDRKFMGRLINTYWPFRWPTSVAFVVMIGNQFLSLVPAYILGVIVDGLTTNMTSTHLYALVVLAGAAEVANTLVVRWRINYEYRRIDYKLPMMLAQQTLAGLFQFSPGQNRSQNSGKIQSVVSQGENALASLLPLLMYNVLPVATQITVAAVALIWLNWLIGLLTTLTIGVYFIVLFWISRKFDRKLDAHQDLRDHKNTLHAEIVRHLPIIQLAGQERRMVERFNHRFETFASYGERMWQSLIGARNSLSLIVNVAKAVIIGLAITSVINGVYGPGMVVTIFMWINRSTNGISQMAYYHKQVIEFLAMIKKYYTIMDVKPAVEGAKNPVRLTEVKGRIQFLDVSFQYPDNSKVLELVGEKKQPSRNGSGKNALRRASFTIEPGERIALVGESGAGKSTVVSLLLRAYDPSEGSITIDGHDLRVLDTRELRNFFGYVEQNVTLWDTSLKENIFYSTPAWKRDLLTTEDLERVLELSRINAFRDRLTEGVHTKIGENGIFLSGGERQRVGIARALIKDPRILILDEATSNLDAVNERYIKEAIDVASKGRTTIIIAHRLSTVRDADRIFVVEKGRITHTGKHDELLATSETYQKLIESQLTQ